MEDSMSRETGSPLNRRKFAALAAGCGATANLIAQDVPQNISNTPAPEDRRRGPRPDIAPFSETLAFSRRLVEDKVRAFPMNAVRLTAGIFKDAEESNRAVLHRLPVDRLLHNFRVTAGLASSATPLGGWEAPASGLRGHFVGHYLSACATLIASTGDSDIKNKAEALGSGIAECQAALDDNRYVSAFPAKVFAQLDKQEKVWAPFYTLHKILAGLLDMNVHGGNSQAMKVLLKLAAWVDVWTETRTEEHMQDILKTEYGGMNEVLYNLAAVTQDDRWARTGDRFTKKIFFTPLAARRDELKGLHANTHMPQVIGAARRYELSSDHRFADVSEFFFETVSESRTYATGGSGDTEGWLTLANHINLERTASSHHQECCCSYNMMKLSRHLYGWSGDTHYIDYYERNLLNHRLGAIQPGTGLTTYFLSLSPAAWKTLCTEDETFWCCTGSALEDYAKLND